MHLKRVGVLSLAKMLAVIYASLGLVFGAIFAVLSTVGVAFDPTDELPAFMGLVFGVGAILALPIFYGIMGFVAGLIVGAVYNFGARLTGGIEVELS